LTASNGLAAPRGQPLVQADYASTPSARLVNPPEAWSRIGSGRPINPPSAARIAIIAPNVTGAKSVVGRSRDRAWRYLSFRSDYRGERSSDG
jgi:hypothetical protein